MTESKNTVDRRALLIVVLTGLVLFFVYISPYNSPISISGDLRPLIASNAVVNQQAKGDTGIPVRLKIPNIKVDSAIEFVGLTPEGAMDVPKGPANAAWYELGPRPGEEGSAVIVGHFGWKNGIPAVFDNVSALRAGDKIYVEDRETTITTFVVRELRTYGEHQDATDIFNSSDGKARLVLITCEGVWNKAEKSYSKRLVVFADKVE